MKRVLLLAVLAACSDDGSPPPIDAAGDASHDVAPGDGGGNGLTTACTGACATTSVAAVFGATTRAFDLAYYGITTEAGAQTLHVEIYRGMTPGCPEMSSPPPEYQIILGRVPIPTSTLATSSPGNVLDYAGDLLGGPLGAAATAVSITPVAADPANGIVALDVELTFAAGTISGHAYATHCASMDAGT